MTDLATLVDIIRQECSRPVPQPVQTLAKALCSQYGDAVKAILFYGSCFRNSATDGGMADLYLLVDTYRHAYGSLFYAFLNKILPPNVFYLEVPYNEHMIRAKYAVFSIKDFEKGTSSDWFHSYLWSRLSQPAGIIYAADSHDSNRVYAAMATSIITFITRVLPSIPGQFACRDLWLKGLELTYSSELRAERQNKPGDLFDFAPQYYDNLTRMAMGMVPFPVVETSDRKKAEIRYMASIPDRIRFVNRIAWQIRRIQGKILSFLRLLKGMLTFDGGLEYILWKIERHSGIRVALDQRLKRIPVLGTAILLWRLYRRGAFR